MSQLSGFRFQLLKKTANALWLFSAYLFLGAIALKENAYGMEVPTPGLEFANVPGRVTLDPDFSLSGRSFTVEAWIWLYYRSGVRAVLAQEGEENLFHLLVRNDRLHFGFWGDDLTGNSTVPINQWVHVAYTYDEATRTQRVYLNGQNDGSREANASFAENNRPLHIGAFLNFNDNPFRGRILELRIWDHVRDGATLGAGRFSTPPLDSPGLEALFTFEGSDGTFLPEATGNLVGNTLHGAVSAVEPVAGPAYLTGIVPLKALPTGTLAEAVESYTFSFAPRPDLSDPDGTLLLNGSGPERVWGTAWLNLLGAAVTSVVGWAENSPEITVAFDGPARVDAVTLFLANSGGANGFGLPTSVQLTTPGGFLRTVAVTPGNDIGGLQSVTLDELDAISETLTVRLERGAHDLALAGVAIDGERMFVQAIDFPLASTALVGSTVMLTPTSDSGLPVTITLESGPALLDGDALTFTGEGVVTLVASQSGDTSFVPAEPVVRIVEVSRAGQAIFNFAEIGDRQVSDTVILEAGSGSALPVQFTVLSGPGVIENSNELRFTGSGIVLVAADQSGNDLWSPAPSSLQAFAVLGGERIFEPEEGLSAGLELGSLPGRLSLDASLSLAGRSFTVEAWIWLNTVGADQPVLAQFGNAGLLHLLVRHGRLHLGFWNDDLTGGRVLPAGEWIHVAYSFDAVTLEQRVYVNGEMDGSRFASAPFPENNLLLHIGGGFSEFSNPFNGRILELRIWDHARPAPILFAGRFETPPPSASGLEALFTFTGSVSTSVPEATGKLADATLSGDAVVVEPVIGPEYLLGFAFPLRHLASGSLAPWVSHYTLDTVPEAAFADPSGSLLSNGFGPARVWGDPWLGSLSQALPSVLVWDAPAPAITFHFSERVRISGVTIHAANSGGSQGIDRPDAVEISTPGGFTHSFALAPTTAPLGTLELIEIENLHLYTDALSLTLSGGSPRIALAEVAFAGGPLADPALQLQSDWLSLPAKRFLGIDLNSEDRVALRMEVVPEAGGTRFEFPRALDDFGVQAVVEWSADLIDWKPLSYSPATELGRAFAYLTPPPAGGRAFFRIGFPDGPPTVVGPAIVSAMESDGPLAMDIRFLPGTIDTPLDPGSFQLLAINDQPVTNFAGPITTHGGGTLEIFPNGNITYAANPGLASGQVAEETFTYTVVDRFGRSVRNTFYLTVVGENDPPEVGNFAGTHTSPVVEAGIRYRYFSDGILTEEEFDTTTPTRTGLLPTFALDLADFAGSSAGLEMTGELFVPASGRYTFYLTGKHGSVLDIGTTRVVDYNPLNHVPERSGAIELTAGTHTIRVRYFDALFMEGEAELSVEYTGPGFSREPIPASAFPRLADLILTVATDSDMGDALHISHLNGVVVPEGEPVVLPSGATLLLAEDGQVIYRPAPGRTVFHEAMDAESFTYTVTDSGGLSASASVEIELVRLNTAPTAVDFTFAVGNDQNGSFSVNDFVVDAEGDALRITHINGEPLFGDDELLLPSSARVRALSGEQGRVFYNGRGSFVRTAAASTATDSLTVTLIDAAGASATATGTLTVNLAADAANNLTYEDARFSPELFGVPFVSTAPFSSWDAPELYESEIPASIRLTNPYRHAVELVIYAKHKATGVETARSTHLLPPGGVLDHTFTPVEAPAPGEPNFFELHDVHVETPSGDFIHYASRPVIVPLYQKALAHYFAGIAVNPERTFEISVDSRFNSNTGVRTGGTFVSYASGRRDVTRSVADTSVSLSLDGIDLLVVPPAKLPLAPTFAANIQITPECRPAHVPFANTFFRVENLNDVSVRVILSPIDQQVLLPPGESTFSAVNWSLSIGVSIIFESSLEHYHLKSIIPITSNCDLFLMTITVVGYSPDASLILFEVTNNSTVTLQNFTIQVEGDIIQSQLQNYAPGQKREVELLGVPGPPFPPVRGFFTRDGSTFNSELISLEDIPEI